MPLKKKHVIYSVPRKSLFLFYLFSLIRRGLHKHISFCLNSPKLQRQIQCSNAITNSSQPSCLSILWFFFYPFWSWFYFCASCFKLDFVLQANLYLFPFKSRTSILSKEAFSYPLRKIIVLPDATSALGLDRPIHVFALICLVNTVNMRRLQSASTPYRLSAPTPSKWEQEPPSFQDFMLLSFRSQADSQSQNVSTQDDNTWDRPPLR